MIVSFLCTRVRYTVNDDYKNMIRVVKYIPGTISLPLILSIDNYVNIKWYVDAAFLVHKDMRGYTGGLVTMVTGGAYVQSRSKY